MEVFFVMTKQTVGRPRKETEKRKYRNLTLSDEVFNGLKLMGNGSASQAVADLYNEKVKELNFRLNA